MKCLETARLMSYAYRLTDEPAAFEVRLHLEECPRCRAIVEQHARLDAVLDEWKAGEPTPGFDARVRQAVEAQPAGPGAWGFRGWQWARGLALAALGILIVAGAAWFIQGRRRASGSSPIATRQTPQANGAQTPAPVASLHSPGVTPQVEVRPAQTGPGPESTYNSSNEDKDAQALDDYDLAANFDLLSEIPKREPRVAN